MLVALTSHCSGAERRARSAGDWVRWAIHGLEDAGHLYLRLAGKGKHYYEKHLSYWGLKRLARAFRVHDYTRAIIRQPAAFEAEYMLPEGALSTKVARILARCAYWLCPGYIWVLEKPKNLQ